MNAKAQTIQPMNPSDESKIFTLDEANRSLPYVGRIVGDIRNAYQTAVEIQERLDQSVPIDDLDLLKAEYDQAIYHLNRYLFELRDVGVELKDYEIGLVDFPAIHEDRMIYFCWKAGEEKIVAWHERDAGFAGRKDIATLQHAPAVV